MFSSLALPNIESVLAFPSLLSYSRSSEMVAPAQWIESQQPDVEPENRVWGFSGDPPNRLPRTDAQGAKQTGAAYPTDRSYAWGLDVSGTLHGAGGVGGLLMSTDGTNHQIPIYDANGNVHALIDADSGVMEAIYSYSAFGVLLGMADVSYGSEGYEYDFDQQPGKFAYDNPFRFASKYYDDDTGLYQYNYRMYSPKLGRFITGPE